LKRLAEATKLPILSITGRFIKLSQHYRPQRPIDVYRTSPRKYAIKLVNYLAETENVEVTVFLPKAIRQADGVQLDMRMQSTKGFGPSQTMTSEIYVVKGLRIECFIGISEHERKEKQRTALYKVGLLLHSSVVDFY
jgi:dihydroneopterin aldolase